MDFKAYLKTYQPLAYHTFLHALEANKISHAYLIKGNEGAPLLECAKFFAKSLICTEDTLACDTCMNCIRFDEGNYGDFMMLDGSKSNIKVEDIEKLQEFFSKTASEKSNKMIYIINQLENSNKEALNALLKFLEEPADNVYAFITTYNETKLLDTILSRTQHIKLLPLKKEEIVLEAVKEGISEDDAEILSTFYTTVSTLVEVASSKEYIKIKDLVFDTLNALNHNKEEALFIVESKVIPTLKSKVDARLYLDILATAFKDILNITYNLPVNIKSEEKLFKSLMSKFNSVDKCYLEIMFVRGQIEVNANIALLLEHLFIFINED